MAIRIGVIGCARILNAHLRGFKILQENGFEDLFEITALCARREEDALRFRKRGEGPPPRPNPIETPGDPLNAPHTYIDDLHPGSEAAVYTDYREMLASGPVDAVVVYTGHENHHTIAVDAMRAGKDVAVEKAMAITVKAGKQMCDAAAETGRVLSVDENVYFGESTRAASAVAEGLIGDVQMVYRGVLGFPSHRPDLVTARTPWRHTKVGAGGGVSIDLGVHIFNGLRAICGPIEAVSAMHRVLEPVRVLLTDDDSAVAEEIANEVDDAFYANFRFANGAMGHATVARSTHGTRIGVPGGTNIFGNRGALSDGKVFDDDGNATDLAERYRSDAPAKTRQDDFPNGITDAYALEQLDWLLAIRDARPPKMSGEEGLMDLALAYAILESGELRREVTVEEVLSGEANAYQAEIDAHYGL